jgi:hypothetical protein
MTAIVGVMCEDGVVIGSDSAASFGFGSGRTIEQPVKKIAIIEGSVIVAGTGQVGLGQRFQHICKGMYDRKEFSGTKHDYITIGKMLSQNAVQDFASTGAPKGQYGCLVAFPLGTKVHLLELAINDFQPEFKTPDMPFSTLGCGQPITDPFLGFLRKVFFANGLPKLQEGKFIAIWALLHAIELNPGGINGPVQVAVLKNTGGRLVASMLEDEELDEQAASVQAAEEHLRAYKALVGGANPAVIPPAPQAPTIA